MVTTAGRLLYVWVWALGLAVGLAVAAAGFPLHGVAVALYLSFGPGVAALRLAGVTDRVSQLALVVPISLAIDAMVASVILYMGVWSPGLVIIVIVLFTVGAITLAPHERSARAASLAMALLPSIVILVGELYVRSIT